jgi:aspartyl protease family protein
VEVVVNGEPLQMLLDTGASHVTLPFEVARKLKLEPGENDPTVQMRLANGAIIEGKLMTLKSVRVGRFTVTNVSCVVLQEGLSDPPTILGTSFLSHFVVKLSQSARELYLTELGDGGKTPGAKSDEAEAAGGK